MYSLTPKGEICSSVLFHCDWRRPVRFWIKWQRHRLTVPVKNVQSYKSQIVDRKCSTRPSSRNSLLCPACSLQNPLFSSKCIQWKNTETRYSMFSLTDLESDQNTTRAKKQTTDLLKWTSGANWWGWLSKRMLERLSEGRENVCGTLTLTPSCQGTIFGCLNHRLVL